MALEATREFGKQRTAERPGRIPQLRSRPPRPGGGVESTLTTPLCSMRQLEVQAATVLMASISPSMEVQTGPCWLGRRAALSREESLSQSEQQTARFSMFL